MDNTPRFPFMLVVGAGSYLGLSSLAWAGTITAQGSVTALDDVSQLQNTVGTADFNEGPSGAQISLTQYQAMGATWHTGALSSILAGVTKGGSASAPIYQSAARPRVAARRR